MRLNSQLVSLTFNPKLSLEKSFLRYFFSYSVHQNLLHQKNSQAGSNLIYFLLFAGLFYCDLN